MNKYAVQCYLHSSGILCFVTGHLLPNVLRPCGDLIFKGQMFEAEFFTKSTNIWYQWVGIHVPAWQDTNQLLLVSELNSCKVHHCGSEELSFDCYCYKQ